jgi:uncharacterized protein YjbI with pentapeptide repeats
MAHPEHLKIIQQGVELWNQWREKHPEEIPDLEGANLWGADLRRAALGKANLHDTNLSGVDLYGATLNEADLSKANLSRALLSKADLSGADLHEATLNGATLYRASLHNTNLSRTILSRTVLSGADLRSADLHEAILYRASLIGTNLSEANITNTYLFGTVRDSWIIDGIKCEYVFWDISGKRRTPKDRNFRPGEFEKLYKYLPTFEYVFEKKIELIDIAIIDQIVKDITELHPEWELEIESFHSRGQSRANFTIREKALIIQALKQIRSKYEATLNKLKGRYEESNRTLLSFIKELTNKPQNS